MNARPRDTYLTTPAAVAATEPPKLSPPYGKNPAANSFEQSFVVNHEKPQLPKMMSASSPNQYSDGISKYMSTGEARKPLKVKQVPPKAVPPAARPTDPPSPTRRPSPLSNRKRSSSVDNHFRGRGHLLSDEPHHQHLPRRSKSLPQQQRPQRSKSLGSLQERRHHRGVYSPVVAKSAPSGNTNNTRTPKRTKSAPHSPIQSRTPKRTKSAPHSPIQSRQRRLSTEMPPSSPYQKLHSAARAPHLTPPRTRGGSYRQLDRKTSRSGPQQQQQQQLPRLPLSPPRTRSGGFQQLGGDVAISNRPLSPARNRRLASRSPSRSRGGAKRGSGGGSTYQPLARETRTYANGRQQVTDMAHLDACPKRYSAPAPPRDSPTSSRDRWYQHYVSAEPPTIARPTESVATTTTPDRDPSPTSSTSSSAATGPSPLSRFEQLRKEEEKGEYNPEGSAASISPSWPSETCDSSDTGKTTSLDEEMGLLSATCCTLRDDKVPSNDCNDDDDAALSEKLLPTTVKKKAKKKKSRSKTTTLLVEEKCQPKQSKEPLWRDLRVTFPIAVALLMVASFLFFYLVVGFLA